MKRIFYFILLMALTSASNYGSSQEKSIIPIQDSIFNALSNLSDPKEQITLLRSEVFSHLGEPWTLLLLDSALKIAIEHKEEIEEISTRFDIVRHHQYTRNRKMFDQTIEELKKKSYEYEIYGPYISAWTGQMQYHSSTGDTEYVILQAENMAKELKRIKYDAGLGIVLLTLGQALGIADRTDEAIKVYQDALALNTTNDLGKMKFHYRLASLYRKKAQYDMAIVELDKRKGLLTNITNKTPINDRVKYRNHWIDTEVAYCRVYSAINNKDSLHKHLLEAEKYYHNNCFYSTGAGYHSHWGEYYRMTKQWDLCFKEFDLAIELLKNEDPFYLDTIYKMKLKALLESKDFNKASQLYKTIITHKDSLNRVIANHNEDVLRANYEIQDALLRKEHRTTVRQGIVGTIAFLLIITLIIAIIRSYINSKKLHQIEKETREALSLSESADKLKELFLRNITYEVRIVLNTVVGFSDILSSEKELTNEECKEYTGLIKQSADKLITLINNVLDLSRLESGMMRFCWQQTDILELCKEVKMIYELKQNQPLDIEIKVMHPTIIINTDNKWLSKVILASLTPESAVGGEKAKMIIEEQEKYVTITTSYYERVDNNKDKQSQRIIESINRLFINICKGSYAIYQEADCKKIIITYPIL